MAGGRWCAQVVRKGERASPESAPGICGNNVCAQFCEACEFRMPRASYKRKGAGAGCVHSLLFRFLLVACGAVFIPDLFEPPGRIKNGMADLQVGIDVAVVVFDIEQFGQFPPFVEHLGGI